MANGEKSEAEVSLRDDLAAGLKAIEEREAAVAPPEDDEAVAPDDAASQAEGEAVETQSDRGDGRDAHGRFVKKSGEEPNPEGDKQEQVEKAEQVPQPDANEAHDAPPKSWRADEAQSWKDLPAPAKAAILRREAETARIAGANDAERMFGREMADIFRPHVQEIQAAGANPQMALKVLLANHNDLRSNDPARKFGTARRLLAEYGIDLQQLAQVQVPDQNITALHTKIAQLEQRLANPQQSQFSPLPPSTEENTIMAEIEAFRADPAHPHFDMVHQRMGQLIETGAATDLESAYHAAVAMDPALRSTVAVQAPQQTQEEKTAAARRASASVTGSPGPAGNPTPLSLRDELRENLRSAGFSV
jgi:hypothetical protein